MELVLRTERLTLIPFDENDIDIALELFTNREVRRYAGGVMPAQEIRDSMSRWIRRGATGCIGIWCITEAESGQKLGTAALLPMPIEENNTDWDLLVPGQMPEADIEIGYFLKPSAWGRGIATEACRRLLQFAFEESPLSVVFATFDEGNAASRKVLLKAGFIDCGTRRSYKAEGPDFRITRDQWLQSNS